MEEQPTCDRRTSLVGRPRRWRNSPDGLPTWRMYNLTTHDDRGQVQPVRKPTCFYTTKKSLATSIAAACGKKGQQCHLFHQPLEGFDPIDKVTRSKAAENYPPYLAKALARALAENEDGIYAQEDGIDAEDHDDPPGVSLDHGDPPRRPEVLMILTDIKLFLDARTMR